jgi:segregation and condensation protein A
MYQMPNSFAIKTEVFEGPLELLLDLIEKRKLLINDISLASVTDEYIAYVRTLQESHLQETSHFVLIASTLLLIKSKSLLPVLELSNEEISSIDDLEYRLKLYQLYRNASIALSTSFGKTPLFSRTYIPDTTPLFTPDARVTTENIKESLLDVIRRFPKKVFRPHVAIQKVISLEEMIKSVEERITKHFKLSFNDFTKSQERKHVIVSFLAILELVKQGTVMVEQEARFYDITVEKEGLDTPRYM